MKQTVEELREKALQICCDNCLTRNVCPRDDGFDCSRQIKIAQQILALFLDQTKDDCLACEGKGYIYWIDNVQKEAGYDECRSCHGTGKVGEWHPELLVVKDKDQKLPTEHKCSALRGKIADDWRIYLRGYSNAQQDMLKAHFVRIKEG